MQGLQLPGLAHVGDVDAQVREFADHPGRLLAAESTGSGRTARLRRVEAFALTCRHCGTENLVAECWQDARPFALSTGHLEGRLREFDDGPVQELPEGLEVPLCDFCSAMAAWCGCPDIAFMGGGPRKFESPRAYSFRR